MSDLIYRQDAINAASKGCWELRGLFHEIETRINKIPSADKHGEWIPVSERLPKMVDICLLGDYANSNPVLASVTYHQKESTAEIVFVYCSDGKWRYFDGAYDKYVEDDDVQVTAWMPLPEPYDCGAKMGGTE